MVVEQGPATAGEKELKTNWPHEEGLILGETKISDRNPNLVAETRLITKSKDL